MNIDTYLKEPLEFETEADRYFDPNDKLTIFEIGACEGEDTIKLRRKFPNADIYAFEPLPKNIKKIKLHYKKYGAIDIRLHQLALSDKDGQAEFFVSSGHPDNLPESEDWDYGNKSSSLLPPKEHKRLHKWIRFDQKIKVKTSRLDNFCKGHSIDAIDLVYLDVQGAELLVLEGAGNLIRNIKLIWMEVESIELYKKQPLKQDVQKFMAKNGFKLVKDTVGEVSGDQLYINRKIIKKPGWRRILNKIRGGALRTANKETAVLSNGLRMEIPEDMAWAFEGGDYYEKNVVHWLEKIAERQNKPVFYDVGANYGFYCLTLAPISRACVAFEPVGATFKVLRSNIDRNDLENVQCNRLALSDKVGRGTINIYSSSGNNSIFNRDLPVNHPTKLISEERIELEPLDRFIKRSGMPPPSLIKVDVEGAEMDVLGGAKNTIKKYMPIIFMEYSVATSKDAGYDRSELLSMLRSFNYRVYGLSSNPEDLSLYSPQSKKVDIDNLIAVPKGMDLKTW